MSTIVSCIMNKMRESDCELIPHVAFRLLWPVTSQRLPMMSNFSWTERYWGGVEQSSADSDLATVLSTPVASTDNSEF